MRKADTMDVPDGCTTIFVRNLAYDVTEEEVGNMFKPCGDISGIRFVYNSHAGHFKGFCYVQFKKNSGVHNALNLNGKVIKSRPIVVDFEDSAPKAGFKFRSDAPSKFNMEYKQIEQKALSKKRNRNKN